MFRILLRMADQPPTRSTFMKEMLWNVMCEGFNYYYETGYIWVSITKNCYQAKRTCQWAFSTFKIFKTTKANICTLTYMHILSNLYICLRIFFQYLLRHYKGIILKKDDELPTIYCFSWAKLSQHWITFLWFMGEPLLGIFNCLVEGPMQCYCGLR